MDHFKEIAAYIPMLGTVMNQDGRKIPPALVGRLIEVAVLAGFFYGVYIKDMESIKTSIAKIETQITKLNTDFYKPRFEN